jgi:5-methylcytosine-specific restriction protein B
LEAYLDRDHQIGHSYLMNLATVADLRFAWEHKVVPLLLEYFYGDGEKLVAVLGNDFVGSKPVKLGSGSDTEERTVYELKPSQPDAAFVDALKKLGTS